VRAVQLALLLICIQVGLGIVASAGLFTGVFYENKLIGVSLPRNISAASETEQISASISMMNVIWNTLTWGWIKDFAQPWYSLDQGVKTFVDSLILFLNSITSIIIAAAFIEFMRNRMQVLG